MEDVMVVTNSTGTTFALYVSSCPFDLALAFFWLAVMHEYNLLNNHENLRRNRNTNEGQPC
jgi:hypothetical protein